jgi:predicted transcriptional regulator
MNTNNKTSGQEELLQELLPFFKALADSNRLRIIGLLANQELSVEQLAELLGLRPSTVSHHLARLSEVGLVSARAESYYNLYRLEYETLEKMSKSFLQQETLTSAAAQIDMDAYDRKIVRSFSDVNGYIKTLPAQRKKLEAILRYIWRAFEPGEHYTEKQVNEIIARYHADTATIRREMIINGMLERERNGEDYWRPEEGSRSV